MSFGFKYGPVAEADLVFDVRCLPNPYYIPELKNHTGLEKCVKDYVLSFDESKAKASLSLHSAARAASIARSHLPMKCISFCRT